MKLPAVASPCEAWACRRRRGRLFTGAESPVASWTRGAGMISIGVRRQRCLGSTLVSFDFGKAPSRRHGQRGEARWTIHDRVAGLDVHKDTVVACVRVMSGAKVERTCRTFGTTTVALGQLRDW